MLWKNGPINLQKYFILTIENAQRPRYYHAMSLPISLSWKGLNLIHDSLISDHLLFINIRINVPGSNLFLHKGFYIRLTTNYARSRVHRTCNANVWSTYGALLRRGQVVVLHASILERRSEGELYECENALKEENKRQEYWFDELDTFYGIKIRIKTVCTKCTWIFHK